MKIIMKINIVGFHSLIDINLFNLPISLDISLEIFRILIVLNLLTQLKAKIYLLAGFAPSIKFKKYKMDLDLGFGIDYQSHEGFDISSLKTCIILLKIYKNKIWN